MSVLPLSLSTSLSVYASATCNSLVTVKSPGPFELVASLTLDTRREPCKSPALSPKMKKERRSRRSLATLRCNNAFSQAFKAELQLQHKLQVVSLFKSHCTAMFLLCRSSLLQFLRVFGSGALSHTEASKLRQRKI